MQIEKYRFQPGQQLPSNLWCLQSDVSWESATQNRWETHAGRNGPVRMRGGQNPVQSDIELDRRLELITIWTLIMNSEHQVESEFAII